MPLLVLLTAFVLQASTSLKFDAPTGWASKPTTSTMRVADWTLPKADGDAEDATLTLYYFGTGGGGGVQANIDRWVGQMTQPDGKATKDIAKTDTLTSNGLKISTIDVTGTYVAEVTPGSTERHNKPGFRMRAAVIETAGGPHYVKFVGPAKTVAKWDASFAAFLKTLRQ